MQDKIIAAIAAYLEKNTEHIWHPSGEKMAFLKPTEYPEFSEQKFCQEIAAEIAAAIAPLVEPKDYPYNELFDHMANEHGLTLTNTELGDIIHVAKSKKMSDNEVSLNRYIFKLTKDNTFLCFKKIDAPNAKNARNKLVRRMDIKPKYKGVRASLFKVLDGTFTKTIWEVGDENDPK